MSVSCNTDSRIGYIMNPNFILLAIKIFVSLNSTLRDSGAICLKKNKPVYSPFLSPLSI